MSYVDSLVPTAQPVYPQPVSSQPSSQKGPTPEIMDLLGYSKFIAVFALIEIIVDSISIFGLIFVCFACRGRKFVNTWNYDDLNCYYIWRLISLVFSFISLAGCFGGDSSTFASMLTSALFSILFNLWVFNICRKARDIMQANTYASADDLRNWYYNYDVSCKCM